MLVAGSEAAFNLVSPPVSVGSRATDTDTDDTGEMSKLRKCNEAVTKVQETNLQQESLTRQEKWKINGLKE